MPQSAKHRASGSPTLPRPITEMKRSSVALIVKRIHEAELRRWAAVSVGLWNAERGGGSLC